MATFGTVGPQGGGTDNPAGNTIWVKATSTPASSGTLTAIHVRCARSTTPALVGAALYTNNAGAPGALLVANNVGVAAGATQADVSIPASVAVVLGTQYWFGVRMPTGGQDIDVDFGAGSGTDLFFEAAVGFPANYDGLGSSASEAWTVWGEYTAGGSPGLMSQAYF